jgi:hypothetical protein
MCSQDVPNNISFLYPIWFAHGSISMYITCKKEGCGPGGSLGQRKASQTMIIF